MWNSVKYVLVAVIMLVPGSLLRAQEEEEGGQAGRQRQRETAATVPEDVPMILFSSPARQGLEAAREQLLVWLDKADAKAGS